METEHKVTIVTLKKEKDIIRQVINESNWYLIGCVLSLTMIGLLMIYSTTLSNSLSYVIKQFFAFLVGVTILFLFSIINYQLFQAYYIHLYGFSVILLTLVLFIGTAYRNTRAWIDFKLFSLQVSEIARILFILSLAGFIDRDYTKNRRLIQLFKIVAFFGLIAFLLILQPDFSALVVYFPIITIMLYLSGVNRKLLSYGLLFGFTTAVLVLIKIYLMIKENVRSSNIMNFVNASLNDINIQYIIVLILIGILTWFVWWILKKLLFRVKISYLILTIIVLWSSYTLVNFSHRFVKLYQQKRLIAFLDPYFDPTGAGYQIIQTRIAIGSGRIFGKGLFGSTQAKLGFVPEKHTDFIFSVICEEFGLLGATIVISLYLLLILEGTKIMFSARDTFGVLLSSSIVSMFAFYFFINVGMCLGILPVVGLPLPFLSYGGSNLVSSYMAVGILNSIHIRRYIY
ncbi:MAG: FtsW/RodA/SpoVE family cell cycle protein [Elusimicrobiota bacterium]|nr:FtsW/RodA/SpoVE family cell cycle protein [Elusimicrobiota bacterium]